MSTFPRTLLCLALLASAPLMPRAHADPLLQKLSFEAMSAGDEEVVQAVTTLHRKGFLERFSQIVREHVQDQDGAAARTAAKIKQVTLQWIKDSFTTKERKVTASSVTAIDWKPGSDAATAYYRMDIKDYSGFVNSFPKFKGHVILDVRTWQVRSWKHSRK